jgi:hypothetical protein
MPGLPLLGTCVWRACARGVERGPHTRQDVCAMRVVRTGARARHTRTHAHTQAPLLRAAVAPRRLCTPGRVSRARSCGAHPGVAWLGKGLRRQLAPHQPVLHDLKPRPASDGDRPNDERRHAGRRHGRLLGGVQRLADAADGAAAGAALALHRLRTMRALVGGRGRCVWRRSDRWRRDTQAGGRGSVFNDAVAPLRPPTQPKAQAARSRHNAHLLLRCQRVSGR